MDVWAWEDLLDVPQFELDTDAPLGAEPAFESVRSLQIRSGSVEVWGDTCRRGGGGGRLGDGVKTAPGLGREEGITVPTPPEPRTRDAFVAGVGGLMDEEADEDGGLPEVLLLLLL